MKGVVWWLLLAWYTSPVWLLALIAIRLRYENRRGWRELYDYLDEQREDSR